MAYRDDQRPSLTSSLGGFLTLTPVIPLVRKSARDKLEHRHLFKLPNSLACQTAWSRFLPHWECELNEPAPNLRRAVTATFGGSLALTLLLMLCSDITMFALPILMPYIIKWFEFNSTLPLYWVFIYTLAISVAGCAGSLFNYHSLLMSHTLGIRLRNSLVSLIYRKTLMASLSRGNSASSVENLVAGDADGVMELMPYFVRGCMSPFELLATIGLLGMSLKYYCLIPLGVAIVTLPLTSVFSDRFNNAVAKHQRAADTRIKQVKELFSVIRIIKYYAWERPFLRNVTASREDEISMIRRYFSIHGALVVLTYNIPTLATGLTYFLYALNNTLTLETTFAAFTYLSMLKTPFLGIPNLLSCMTAFRVSLKRIQFFVLSANLASNITRIDDSPDISLQIQHGYFAWENEQSIAESKYMELDEKAQVLKGIIAQSDDSGLVQRSKLELKDVRRAREKLEVVVTRMRKADLAKTQRKDLSLAKTTSKAISDAVPGDLAYLPEPENTLHDIDLEIHHGELTMVVGGVGSGKSSLASAFCGETLLTSGSVSVCGDIAYAPQEAWIVNGTVRDNIVFGAEFNLDWYNEVIASCSLAPDLKGFVAGDLTEIGERGVTLSGGQRARLGVARAMYSDRKIVILDDPFSAVDAQVGDYMFQNVVLKLRERGVTVVLITNQLQWLYEAATIVVLKKGRIVEYGTFDDLVTNGPETGTLSKLLLSQTASVPVEAAHEGEEATASPKAPSELPIEDASNTFVIDTTKDEENRKIGELVQQEEKESGAITAGVYGAYAAAGGSILMIFAILTGLLRFATRYMGGLWLSWWSTNNYPFAKEVWLGSYLGFVGGEIFFHIIYQILFIYWGAMASRTLHRRMLHAVSRSPIAWFDVTPIGRILTRFTSDMRVIDLLLPDMLSSTLSVIFTILGCLATMATGSLYLLILVGVSLFAYAALTLHFRKAAVAMQRLESLARAPIQTNVNETLTGAAVIRAYGRGNDFREQNMHFLNQNSLAMYTLKASSMWFALNLGMMASVTVAIAFVVLILLRTYSPSSISLELIIYALSNCGPYIVSLSSVTNTLTETESSMAAIERVQQFTKHIPSEGAEFNPAAAPPPSWPQYGSIVIDNLTLEYRQGKPVLKGISAFIRPREKIGVVGRTGAGKSTLATALFRTVEFLTGKIIIDGIDISTIGLFDLRSKISLIPQIPQLFTGTIRYNLDPFNEHSDEKIWTALRQVKLHDYVSDMDGKLLSLVEAGGTNFSVGQRQLLAMARCLLRDTHILILDEATAAIDIETDALIQEMLRKHFQDRTVITIAHRLNTVMDSDRIMVLDSGNIAEFDTPKNLLANKTGLLSGMIEATGPETANFLRSIALGKTEIADAYRQLARETSSTTGDMRLANFGRLLSRHRLGTISIAKSDTGVVTVLSADLFGGKQATIDLQNPQTGSREPLSKRRTTLGLNSNPSSPRSPSPRVVTAGSPGHATAMTPTNASPLNQPNTAASASDAASTPLDEPIELPPSLQPRKRAKNSKSPTAPTSRDPASATAIREKRSKTVRVAYYYDSSDNEGQRAKKKTKKKAPAKHVLAVIPSGPAAPESTDNISDESPEPEVVIETLPPARARSTSGSGRPAVR